MRTSACFVLLSLALIIAPPPTIAQPPPPPAPSSAVRDNQAVQKTGTARLSGRVVAADTGKPLRRAVVRTFASELQEGRSVSTDADGRWELRQLPAGRYTVTVTKGGYVTLGYGQQRPFEQPKVLDVTDGQALEKLDVSLPKGSVVAGRILDEFGEPMSGARVQAMRYRYVGGQRRLVSIGNGDTTDDIGQYRLHGLSPGEYFISASFGGTLMFGQSDDRTGYAPTFYPGISSMAEAQRIALAESQEAQNVSFSLTPTRVAIVSGSITNSSGKPVTRGTVMLTTISPTATSPMGNAGMIRPDGTFTISNVSPGEYRLQAQYVPNIEEIAVTGGTGSLTVFEVAFLPITVSGRDVTGIALVTAPGGTATGRVVFDGGTPPSTPPANMAVGAGTTSPGMFMLGGGARVKEDWAFEIRGLSERRLFRINGAPSGWFLKSVSVDSTDITDTGYEFKEGQTVSGIEMMLTQRTTNLSGTVQDERARPITEYAVVAFSADSGKWGYQTRFVRSVRPNQDGTFLLKGLPPDDYLVVALDYLEAGEETDPEQLEKWKSSGTRVTLAEGEAKSINLKLRR